MGHPCFQSGGDSYGWATRPRMVVCAWSFFASAFGLFLLLVLRTPMFLRDKRNGPHMVAIWAANGTRELSRLRLATSVGSWSRGSITPRRLRRNVQVELKLLSKRRLSSKTVLCTSPRRSTKLSLWML